MSGKVNFGPEQVAEMAKDSTKHYNHVPYPNAENKRLGVPSMRFCDGPRVVVCGTGKSTPVFPFLCSGGPPSIPRWKKK
jgi:beta-glucosidase